MKRKLPRIRSSPGAVTLDGPLVPLVSARQLADYLNVSPKTVVRLVKANEIQAVRIGEALRFDVHAVRRALSEGRSPTSDGDRSRSRVRRARRGEGPPPGTAPTGSS